MALEGAGRLDADAALSLDAVTGLDEEPPDDEHGNLIITAGAAFSSPRSGFTYTAEAIVGAGSAGVVVRVFANGSVAKSPSAPPSAAAAADEPSTSPLLGSYYAMKVVRNRPAFSTQAGMEVNLLLHVARVRAAQPAGSPVSDGLRSVVSLVDYFLHGGHWCLVFEWLPGTALDALTARGFTGIPLPAVAIILRQLCTSLHALHTMGIVHSDIKPENVMLAGCCSERLLLERGRGGGRGSRASSSRSSSTSSAASGAPRSSSLSSTASAASEAPSEGRAAAQSDAAVAVITDGMQGKPVTPVSSSSSSSSSSDADGISVASSARASTQSASAGKRALKRTASLNKTVSAETQAELAATASAARAAAGGAFDVSDQLSVVLIDFGSAGNEHTGSVGRHPYAQSRFYRAPEVTLGLPWDVSVDMWGVGCLAAELWMGLPIFAGTDNHDCLARVALLLGHPPEWMLASGSQVYRFYAPSPTSLSRLPWAFEERNRDGVYAVCPPSPIPRRRGGSVSALLGSGTAIGGSLHHTRDTHAVGAAPAPSRPAQHSLPAPFAPRRTSLPPLGAGVSLTPGSSHSLHPPVLSLSGMIPEAPPTLLPQVTRLVMGRGSQGGIGSLQQQGRGMGPLPSLTEGKAAKEEALPPPGKAGHHAPVLRYRSTTVTVGTGGGAMGSALPASISVLRPFPALDPFSSAWRLRTAEEFATGESRPPHLVPLPRRKFYFVPQPLAALIVGADEERGLLPNLSPQAQEGILRDNAAALEELSGGGVGTPPAGGGGAASLWTRHLSATIDVPLRPDANIDAASMNARVLLADFVARCLAYDPRQRLTAGAALSHPFLTPAPEEGPCVAARARATAAAAAIQDVAIRTRRRAAFEHAMSVQMQMQTLHAQAQLLQAQAGAGMGAGMFGGYGGAFPPLHGFAGGGVHQGQGQGQNGMPLFGGGGGAGGMQQPPHFSMSHGCEGGVGSGSSPPNGILSASSSPAVFDSSGGSIPPPPFFHSAWGRTQRARALSSLLPPSGGMHSFLSESFSLPLHASPPMSPQQGGGVPMPPSAASNQRSPLQQPQVGGAVGMPQSPSSTSLNAGAEVWQPSGGLPSRPTAPSPFAATRSPPSPRSPPRALGGGQFAFSIPPPTTHQRGSRSEEGSPKEKE